MAAQSWSNTPLSLEQAAPGSGGKVRETDSLNLHC